MTALDAPATSSAFLTDEQLALQAQARRYATEELLPIANRVDREKIDIPSAVLDRMAELGYFGIRVGTEYGGLGLGVLEYCIVAEELARAWMSAASIIARANGTGCEVADQDRRAELLRRSASGRWIGAVAFSEPEAGSDLGNVSCKARLDGEEWVITGEKRWCGNALAGDFILLLARTTETDPEQRWRGLESFLIEKPRGTFPEGLSGYIIDKIGYHGMTSWHLQFDGLRLPASAILPGQHGGDGEAFRDAVHRLNIARVHTAARAVGLARGGLEDALLYAQSRKQFRKPLVGFQVIRHKLAEMATQVEAGRQLFHHAARLMDLGVDARREVAMAKLFCSEMAERVTSEALQVLGGNGYTTEYAVERYWRDARLTKIFEGTSDIQREIISRSLIGGRS